MRTTLNIDDELLENALARTGLTSKTELVNRALRELIQRDAGRQLIAMGGTMPDAAGPERDRIKRYLKQQAEAELKRVARSSR